MIRDGVASGALVRTGQPWDDAQLARLYDAFAFDGDLGLYRELARRQGGRVLEVGCGTGRVLLPLVNAGCDVTGIDASPHMLALLQQKLENASRGDELGRAAVRHERLADGMGRAAVRHERLADGKAQLVRADMRDFRIEGEPFDLAIIAVKTFAYLLERADQLRCLQTVADHLRPGGVLALDLLHPTPAWVGEPVGQLRQDLIATGEDGVTVSRVESVVTVDLARQVRVIRSAYEVIDAHGSVVQKRFVEWPYRWTHRFEAELLLERCGLEIEAVYGGYAGEPLTSESRTMLFVTRRP